jgi:hypothetical protein
MTKRTQRSTGEVISTIVFAGGGLVLLGGALDAEADPGSRIMLGLGALGGFAAAGRFLIAAIWTSIREERR